MNPSGAGRMRGFRAPSAEEHVRNPPAEPATDDPPANPSAVEYLETPQPPRASRSTGWITRWRSALASGSGSSGSGWRWTLATAGVLLVAIMVIAALAFKLGSTAATSADQAAKTPAPTPAKTATPLPVTDLFRQVVPSVVLITTSKGSLGSGTIVTDTGTVLTANHVVSGGGTISIVFVDGTKAAAKVASADPKTDTATLIPNKLPEVVVAATLGGGVAVGADVVAIGNPLGLRDSTSTGVVSGLNRTTKTEAGSLAGLIQFDAAVNPGSSGGPLLDAQGLVIGVVVSIADPGKDDAFAGIGFAVPIGAAIGGAGDGPGQGGGPQL